MNVPQLSAPSEIPSEYSRIFDGFPYNETFLWAVNVELVQENFELSRLQTLLMGVVNDRVSGNFFKPTSESVLTGNCFAVGRAAVKTYLNDKSLPIPIVSYTRERTQLEIVLGCEAPGLLTLENERPKVKDYIDSSKKWLAEKLPNLSESHQDYAGFGFLSVYRFLKRQQEIDKLRGL